MKLFASLLRLISRGSSGRGGNGLERALGGGEKMASISSIAYFPAVFNHLPILIHARAVKGYIPRQRCSGIEKKSISVFLGAQTKRSLTPFLGLFHHRREGHLLESKR